MSDFALGVPVTNSRLFFATVFRLGPLDGRRGEWRQKSHARGQPADPLRWPAVVSGARVWVNDHFCHPRNYGCQSLERLSSIYNAERTAAFFFCSVDVLMLSLLCW